MEVVSQIAGVETPRTIMEAGQARLMGKILRDPTAAGDLVAKEEGGITTTVTVLLKRVEDIAGGEKTKLSFEGPVDKVDIPEMKFGLSDRMERKSGRGRFTRPGSITLRSLRTAA